MNFKYLIPIVIIILAILSIGYMNENNIINLKNDKKVVNGSFNFTLPEGYDVVKQTDNEVDLSNGDNNINIYKLNNNDSVEIYKEKYSNEFNITSEEFSIENVNKTVAINDEYSIIKYWFVKNDKKFQIQMISNEANSDKIAETIINSLEA